MIWSVSTFARSRWLTVPAMTLIGSIYSLLSGLTAPKMAASAHLKCTSASLEAGVAQPAQLVLDGVGAVVVVVVEQLALDLLVVRVPPLSRCSARDGVGDHLLVEQALQRAVDRDVVHVHEHRRRGSSSSNSSANSARLRSAGRWWMASPETAAS